MATKPTHIDFQGHHGFAAGTLFDLQQVTTTADRNHWIVQHWKQEASRWHSFTEILEDIKELAAQRPEQQALLDRGNDALVTQTTCGECGAKVQFVREGDRFVAREACSAPGGLAPYTIDVHVPSGVLVFANDLRPLVLVEDGHDVNKAIGCKRCCEDHAAQGMVHFFVGNTCPAVATRNGAILVANFWADEDDDLDVEEEGVHDRICTDLWWASAMDKDLFLERCALFGHDPQTFDFFEVPVTPGVYGVEVLVPDRDAEGDVVHARITRVERPAPALFFPMPTDADRACSSGMAKELDQVASKPYLGIATRNMAATTLLLESGMGYRWSQGHLRALNGHPGDPKPDLTGVDGSALRAATTIPALPYAPLFQDLFNGHGYTSIERVPEGVDRWWLAVSILTAQAALDAHKAWGNAPPPGSSKETAERWSEAKALAATAALDALVDRLFAIATRRNIGGEELGTWLVEAHAFLTEQTTA
jgi:hypothetical protein